MTTTLIVKDTAENLLQAWLNWGNTHAEFLFENKAFMELMIKTQTFLKKSEPEV